MIVLITQPIIKLYDILNHIYIPGQGLRRDNEIEAGFSSNVETFFNVQCALVFLYPKQQYIDTFQKHYLF